MLTSLRVRDYRALNDLRIGELGRINLISGKNNSGKTTLLESLMLLSFGHPEITLHPLIIRGMTSENLPSNAIPSVYWAQLFPLYDIRKIVNIDAQHETIGQLRLQIEIEYDEIVRKSVHASTDAPVNDELQNLTLLASIWRGDKDWKRRIRATESEIQVERRTQPIIFPAFFVPAGSGDFKNDATCLDTVKRRKEGDRVVQALRILDQSLASLEVISATGTPMIWADVGLPELVPLPTVGEGMLRICRLTMGMVIARGGVLLVDEVENGVHHSMVARLWQFIADTARNLDVQVFATTHSYECVQAAQSIDGDDLMLHRLEVSEGRHRCVSYHREHIDTAVRHSLEVR